MSPVSYVQIKDTILVLNVGITEVQVQIICLLMEFVSVKMATLKCLIDFANVIHTFLKYLSDLFNIFIGIENDEAASKESSVVGLSITNTVFELLFYVLSANPVSFIMMANLG